MEEVIVGEKVKVFVTNSALAREGKIIYKNPHFFTIKFKNYPESFQYFELKTGNVRLEILH